MIMNKKFYITTAIPYVNAAPHLGFVLEVVQADTIARYHRLLDEDVYFLAGTDENALKNVQAAEEEGITTQKLVDRNAKKFFQLKKALNLSYDDFIRTTEKRHIKGVQALWQACKKEDIYKKKYQGLYCLGCEAFYTKKDLVDGKCPEHKKELEMVEEENYFFRLSKYQTSIIQIIEEGKLKIIPESRKNEILAFVKSGLKDFSISRSKKRTKGWGIPVPGDPSQIIYVWFDALANYLTALNWDKNDKLYQKYWPADLHVIGKGIIRFHAIYWPAILKSAGILLPKQEFVHGYVTVEGEKISKSRGNVIDPFELVNKYGTDAVRYYLLREIPPFKDSDFSLRRFKELYNADLANGLGNFIQRTLTLAKKYFNSRVPKIDIKPESLPLQGGIEIQTWKKYDRLLKDYKFNEALDAIWKFISAADKYIDENKPWELAKKQQTRKLSIIVFDLLESLHQIAWMIYPFLPRTAQEIDRRLGGKSLIAKKPLVKESWNPIKPGNKIKTGKPLFPRIK